MEVIKLVVRCANCGENIEKRIGDFTGKGIVDVDLMIGNVGFDCDACNQSTAITLIKESF